MGVATVGGVTYHVSNLLLRHWERNSLERMKKTNSDRVYIVDGMERSGKSTWAIQQAGVLDKKMFENPQTFASRMVFSAEDFLHAVRSIKNGVIIFDEAFRGFSSRSALSKVNRQLITGLMEMGQNNNIVFIVLPRIFMLDAYPKEHRSHGLFNIYIDKKSGKRVWRGWNQQHKNIISRIGMKKGYAYPVPTSFRGNFYSKFPGGDEFEKAYLAKKRKAFVGAENIMDQSEQDSRYMIQRDLLLKILYENYFKSAAKLSKRIKQEGIDITPRRLSYILKKFKEEKVIGLVEPSKGS